MILNPGPEYAWEQRRLNEFVNYTSSSLTIGDAQINGDYNLYDANSVIGKVSKGQMGENYITIIKDGAGVGRIRMLPKNTAFIGTMGAISSNKSNLFFIYALLTSKDLSEQFTGSTIPHIYFKDYGNENYYIPYMKEQEKIGLYFNELDNLITLHQREYDKTVNLKKAMLEKMFPKNGEDRPEIRFKGFTDAWEQRKLKDLCDLFTDGDWIEAKDQSDLGIRLIQTGNIGVTEFIDKNDNAKWISKETFDKLHCEKVFPGDILISRLPEPAGRACVVPTMGTEMITAVDCTIVRTAHDCSNIFLIQFLSTQGYFNDVNAALAGGTRQRISRSNLASFSVLTPSLNEQEAIGTFLNYFDNLITLHQRELIIEIQLFNLVLIMTS